MQTGCFDPCDIDCLLKKPKQSEINTWKPTNTVNLMLIQHNESVCLELITFPILLQWCPFHFTWKASTLFLLINEDGLPPSKMNLGTAPPSPIDMEAQLQRATELCCSKELCPGEHHPCSACIGGDDKHNAQYHHPCSGLLPSSQVSTRKRRAPVLS